MRDLRESVAVNDGSFVCFGKDLVEIKKVEVTVEGR